MKLDIVKCKTESNVTSTETIIRKLNVVKKSPKKEETPEILKILSRMRSTRKDKLTNTKIDASIDKSKCPEIENIDNKEGQNVSDFEKLRSKFEVPFDELLAKNCEKVSKSYFGCKPKVYENNSQANNESKQTPQSNKKKLNIRKKKSEKVQSNKITTYFGMKHEEFQSEVIKSPPKVRKSLSDALKRSPNYNNIEVNMPKDPLNFNTTLPQIMPLKEKTEGLEEKSGRKDPLFEVKSPQFPPGLRPSKSSDLTVCTTAKHTTIHHSELKEKSDRKGPLFEVKSPNFLPG